MGKDSKIEWTDHTFNPWTGCTKVSPGCDHCYAESWAKRSGLVQWGDGNPRRKTSETNWRQPVKWNEAQRKHQDFLEGQADRPRVFCASLADWLDDEVPIEWLADLLDLIRKTPELDWLLLTKRPENFADRMGDVVGLSCVTGCGENDPHGMAGWMANTWRAGKVIPHNVWIGTTVEDQKRADERIPALLEIPAEVRFLSCEPLLERLDLSAFFGGPYVGLPGDVIVPNYNFGIDWIIVGGESGPGARPIEKSWVLEIRERCDAAQVAFFFKQWGGLRPAENGRLLEGLIFDGIPSANEKLTA